MREKINKKTLLILSSGQTSELFFINKKDEFEFKRGKFKGLTVQYLYETNGDLFIEWLEEIWYQVNIIDKNNIDTIIKELTKIND
jgi:hypothetical protein